MGRTLTQSLIISLHRGILLISEMAFNILKPAVFYALRFDKKSATANKISQG